jgi:acyl carrier protein
MRLASADAQRRYRGAGLEPMPAAEALDARGRLLGGSAARPLLSRLGGARLHRAAAKADAAPALQARLRACPEGMRHEAVVEFIRGEVAAVLCVEEGGRSISTHAGLFELGMDSLMSVELKRRLERAAGRPLPSTLTFNYPNVGALAGFLERELGGAGVEAARDAEAKATASPPPPSGDDLDALSEAELEERLRARLERTR